MARSNPKAQKRQSRDTRQPRRGPGGPEVVQHRNRTSYDLAAKSLRVARWSAISASLGITIGVLGWVLRPDPVYFATNEDGRLIELRPLDQAIHSRAQLINWATRAVTEAYTFDWVNYRNDLAKVEDYFTTEGFNSFIKALKDSGNLESVVDNRYVVTAAVAGSPKVINDRVINDRQYWRIKIPIQIGYESAKSTRSQTGDALVTLVRVPAHKKPDGIAIQQFILE